MNQITEIIAQARRRGERVLSERDSKKILSLAGLPAVAERDAPDMAGVLAAAEELGYPVVLKALAPGLAHKTELGLVELDLRRPEELRAAHDRLAARTAGAQGRRFLVQAMVKGGRELAAGLIRDQVFGPCVMFGLGGVYLEILDDVVFRPAPLSLDQALEMLGEIRGARILSPVRGQPPADRAALAGCLVALGRLGLEHPEVEQIDINPLILQAGRPLAVDALVVLKD